MKVIIKDTNKELDIKDFATTAKMIASEALQSGLIDFGTLGDVAEVDYTIDGRLHVSFKVNDKTLLCSADTGSLNPLEIRLVYDAIYADMFTGYNTGYNNSEFKSLDRRLYEICLAYSQNTDVELIKSTISYNTPPQMPFNYGVHHPQQHPQTRSPHDQQQMLPQQRPIYGQHIPTPQQDQYNRHHGEESIHQSYVPDDDNLLGDSTGDDIPEGRNGRPGE